MKFKTLVGGINSRPGTVEQKIKLEISAECTADRERNKKREEKRSQGSQGFQQSYWSSGTPRIIPIVVSHI